MNPLGAKLGLPETLSRSHWEDMGGNAIWLPYTQMKTASTPLLASRTAGSRIVLSDGRELVDGVASWWTACHGYNHPTILRAMHAQLDAMSHVMFGGINHEPALRLAKRLAALAPGDLQRVFFVDSGSVAIEAALKMAAQYWVNKGEPNRRRFIHFRHGYHGDTSACMALCDPGLGMYGSFINAESSNFLIDLPCDDAGVARFERFLNLHAHEIAALVLEPLVQGVGGMKFHSPQTLKRTVDIARRFGVLTVADEIFTGFGRTGTFFACTQAEVVPDIMCVGKALSACTVTLAAVIARPHIFDAFLSDDHRAAFMHGPTYMANPLACAAANASLDLFENEPRLTQATQMQKKLSRALEICQDLKGVADVRSLGAIGVVQMRSDLDHRRVREKFIERGVWVRSWGDHIYLTPPLNISDDDLYQLTDAVVSVVHDVA